MKTYNRRLNKIQKSIKYIMKKICILLLVSVLGTSTMFAQGFGASLDYAMWNGAMIENSETTGSTIISVNYTQNLSKKMDLVGSVGYGIGFGVLPIKTDLNYGITNKLSANLGMGIYMISDDTYKANANGVGNEAPKFNEFGTNLGLSYQLTSALSLGFNYNMLKNDVEEGSADFNAMQFGLAYSFSGKSKAKTDKKKVKKKKKVATPKKVVTPTKKKVVAPNSSKSPQ